MSISSFDANFRIWHSPPEKKVEQYLSSVIATGCQRLPSLEPRVLEGPRPTSRYTIGRLRSGPGSQVQDKSSGRELPSSR